MGTSTTVTQQKGTPVPTQQTAPTQQAPTQQTGKGAAPTQVSKDTFQAPTQAQKGVAVPKGAVMKGATQGTCETSSTTPTSTEGCAARVEDRTKHYFAGLRADLSGLGSEMEAAIDNFEHMCGDFAGHVKGLLTKETTTTSTECSGTSAESTTTACSTQGAQGQAQAQAQFSKGGKGVVLPTQQAPVQQSKGAPVKGAPTQQAPVQQSKGEPVKGAPVQQAPVQKGGK